MGVSSVDVGGYATGYSAEGDMSSGYGAMPVDGYGAASEGAEAYGDVQRGVDSASMMAMMVDGIGSAAADYLPAEV